MNGQPPYDETEVLKKLSQGEEKAFRAIYDRYRKKIASFTWQLTGSEELTDEILQEVFVKLWINRSKLNDIHNFNAWLHTVTRNLVSDSLKKIAKEKAVVRSLTGTFDTADWNDYDNIVFGNENEHLLTKAIDRLTPQQRQVFLLSKDQGRKNDEIARSLGIHPMTVKNHLVNAKRSIMEYFKEHIHLLVIVSVTMATVQP